jgi:hypothetical protein
MSANVRFEVTFSNNEGDGSDTSEVIALTPRMRCALLHLPAVLAANTAALLVLVQNAAGTFQPVDAFDEDPASADPLHIKCAATNTRTKRLDPATFSGISVFKLKAVQSDLSTAVLQAVGEEEPDLVFYGEARAY